MLLYIKSNYGDLLAWPFKQLCLPFFQLYIPNTQFLSNNNVFIVFHHPFFYPMRIVKFLYQIVFQSPSFLVFSLLYIVDSFTSQVSLRHARATFVIKTYKSKRCRIAEVLKEYYKGTRTLGVDKNERQTKGLFLYKYIE